MSFEVYGIEGRSVPESCCSWGAAAILTGEKVFNSLTGRSCEIGECSDTLTVLSERVRVLSTEDWSDYYGFVRTESPDSVQLFSRVWVDLLRLPASTQGKPLWVGEGFFLVGKDNLELVLGIFAQETIILAKEALDKKDIDSALKWSGNCLMFDHLNQTALKLRLKYGSEVDRALSVALLRE